MRKAIALVFALTIAVAGCSDSSEEASEPATTSAAPTTAAGPSDQQRVDSLLLTRDDLPPEWTETAPPPEVAAQQGDLERELATCLGLEPDALSTLPARADRFFAAATNLAVSSATAETTLEEADASRVALTGDKGKQCLVDQTNSSIADELSSLGVPAGIVPTSTAGDIPGIELREGEFGLRITTKIDVAGQQINAVSDYLNVATDRYDSALNIAYVNGVPQDGLTGDLLEKMRMRAAQ